MSGEAPHYDVAALEAMNAKAIQNQFFTPDHVYMDLSLFKDIPIGIVYADLIMRKASEPEFNVVKDLMLTKVETYQKRIYDTVDPFFVSIGYDDDILDILLNDNKPGRHDTIFLVAPKTAFLSMLIRHTVRNQNNSQPANKFHKKSIDAEHYVLEAMPVTYYINTHPLTLSTKILEPLAVELGEALGVNIRFLNKDPALFDLVDWEDWIKNIDCFYLNSFGRFNRSDFIIQKQEELDFMGRYVFARKRFEKCVMKDMIGVDFEQQIQMITAQQDMLCDFSWLQNNDVRLTEKPQDVPIDTPSPVETDGIKP